MKKNYFFAFSVVLQLFMTSVVQGQVVINEYCAANKNGQSAYNGQRYDWFELYNAGASAVSLGGWYVTDDKNDLLKWQIPAGLTLNAGAFRIIYCSDLDGVFSGQYHTSFKITQSDTSDEIMLTDNGGIVRDSVKVFPCRMDNSRGRTTNGAATWAVFTTPTPGTTNNTQTAYLNYVPKVVFSLPAGFYSGAQSVSLSCPQSNVTIRYTTNGTTPTTASTAYSTPISVTANTVIKAKAFDNGTQYASGFTETNSYFINETHTLAVMSLSSNQFTNLFNGSSQQITGSMEFFSENNQQLFEIEGEYNPHGNDSWAYPQKGVDFNIEDEYGVGAEVKYHMFRTSPRKKFKWFILKAAASDNYPGNSGHPGAHIRDAYVQTLAEKFDLNLDPRRMEHCLVFINGQYWGVYEIRERVDADYFEYYYNQDEKWVDDLQYWGGMNIKYGSDTAWNNLYNYIITHNLAVQSNYQYVADRLNVVSLIDRLALGMYTLNSDWINWNTAWWRGRKTPNNVKWKYWMWDEDNTFNLGENYTGLNSTNYTSPPCDAISATDPYSGVDYSDPNIGAEMGHIVIFNALMQNQGFKQLYVNRFADLINTAFNCTNMLNHLDTMVARIQPEMQRHCQRWSGSYNTWLQHVQFLRNQINGRCAVIGAGMDSCFQLTGPYPTTVDVYPHCAGTVTVNTTTPDSYPWSGSYYGGVNITLNAHPAGGWQFSHWQLVHTPQPNANADSIWFDLGSSGDSIVAVFTQVAPQQGQLFVQLQGNNPGTVTINGTPVANNQTYNYTLGTQLSVAASPVPGCSFYHYILNHTHLSPNDTLETGVFCFRQNDTLVAVFDQCSVVPDSLTIVIQQPGYGNVSINSITVPFTPVTIPVTAGTLLNIAATPAAGYTFSQWQTAHHSILPNNTTATASFTFNQRDTLIAIFTAPDTVDLTVMVNPTGGNVNVNGNTPGAYPTVLHFVNGTAVNISATANTGFAFTNWSLLHHVLSPNANTPNAGFTITQHDTLVANFTANPDTFNLTVLVNPIGGGNVNVNGNTPGAYPANLQLVSGTVVNLAALASAGYSFSNWVILHHTLSPGNTSANATFTITQGDTLLANFLINPNPPDTFNLTVLVNPAGGGNVTINGTTPATYPAVLQIPDGSLVNITATANAGYTFSNWTVLHHSLNPNSTTANAGFVITQADTLVANFTINPTPPDTFNLTVVVNPAGAGNININGNTPAGYPTVLQFVNGTAINIAALANAGYSFSNWFILHHSLAPNNNSATANFIIAQNDTLVANFTVNPNPPDTFNLTVLVNPASGGNVTVNSTALSAYPVTMQLVDGSLVNISALANAGYNFSSWSLLHHSLNPNNSSASASFVITQADTVVANFTAIPVIDSFDIVLQAVPGAWGTITVNSSTYGSFPATLKVADNTLLNCTATPNSTYQFTGWQLLHHTAAPNNTANPISFTVTQNDTLFAFFEPVPADSFDIVVNVKPHLLAGKVIVAGITPASYPWKGRFEQGTNVDFDAQAAAGYSFTHYNFIYHTPVPNTQTPIVFINVQHPDTVIAWFEVAEPKPDSTSHILIPSGFSPDGDGMNDVFRVVGEQLGDFNLQVFNRWGQKVFESNTQGYGWNGEFKGQKCDIGVYAYMLVAKRLTGEEVKLKGTITLLR